MERPGFRQFQILPGEHLTDSLLGPLSSEILLLVLPATPANGVYSSESIFLFLDEVGKPKPTRGIAIMLFVGFHVL